MKRRITKQIKVGKVGIGSDYPISVQSMTTTKTRNTDETIQQVYELANNGADIVRVTCNDIEAAKSLVNISTRSPVPIIADIHFQYKLALAAIEAGVQGLRLNPGNIRNEKHIKAVAKEALLANVPIRIGVNAGSLDKDISKKYGDSTPKALVESALKELKYLEEVEFHNIKISVKHSNVPLMIESYRLLSEKVDYPLHLGVTEAGPLPGGLIKSVSGISTLLSEGIGDTIRFSFINHMFAKWIKSHRDLPMLINQWANVVRWEMRTRLFLRTSEFLWQEGHTAHKTQEEATSEALQMLDIYAEFAENAAGVSVVKGIKSANERFAGATTTYSIEAMMKDKKALQAGTSHELGQNFSKAFEIQYSDENNELQHPFQTSWGVSTRLIGMIIMAHGDDKGLQLPPKLAPTQSVLIPIIPNEDSKSVVLETVNKLHEELRESYRMKIDDRDNISPGFKFNEWELKGVPLRIEIGPKDIEKNSVVFSRRDGVDGKNSISINEVSQKLKDNLDDIQSNLLETSKNFRKDNTIHVDSKAELIDTLNSTPGFVTCYWDENTSDEIEIKDLTKATLRCYLLENEGSAKAVNNESVEGKKAIFSKAY